MTEHFYFRGHLCIASELLSINLYELIKANGFVGFSTVLIRRFTSQMLQSLVLMRHHRIVHCDLKPEVRRGDTYIRGSAITDLFSQNVLLRHPAKSAIKVIDFGSSCFEHEKSEVFRPKYKLRRLLTGMFSLHLHTKSLLSLTGSHPRHELSYGHRHVEFRLYHGGAVHGLPHLPW